MENPLLSFTKLLQAHTYNTLHTWAACSKSLANERLNLLIDRSPAGDICHVVHPSFHRPTNCRTKKNKYDLVAPNIRRTVFGVRNCIQILQWNRMSLRWAGDNSDTQNIRFKWVIWSRILSFKRRLRNLKVTLVSRSIGKKLELILRRNKSEKGIAKKVSITIMRFPRWHIDCHIQSGSAACWMIVWRLTSSHIFSRNCPETFNLSKSGKCWGVTLCELRKAI